MIEEQQQLALMAPINSQGKAKTHCSDSTYGGIATAFEGSDSPNDGNYVWEWWYMFQVNDNISVTPALFYLSRPLSQATPAGKTFNQLGGVLKTTFRF